MFNATVIENKFLNSGLFILKIKPDATVATFRPGQYITLGLPVEAPRPEDGPADPENIEAGKLIRRAYSVASSPDQLPELEFYIALVVEGALTPRLSLLKSSDRIYMTEKFVGKFTLDDCQESKQLVFFSTGTGAAPFISMLRTKSTWELSEKIILLHGVRFNDDLSYDLELRELMANSEGRFRYVPVVSREDAPKDGFRGHVQKSLPELGIKLDPDHDHVFACGNPAMITDLESSLLAQGFKLHKGKEKGNLHLEKYW